MPQRYQAPPSRERGRAFGRRSLLRGAFGVGAAATVGSLTPWQSLVAQPRGDRRFVGLYFQGGWDVLLGPDARDPSRRYGPELNLGTNLLAPADRDPFPVRLAGREYLWGAPMASLARHVDVATVIRGVNMNTVAHETGRAYCNSFIQPAGTAVRGDSLSTRMSTAARHDDLIVPSVVVGLPAYNLSFGPDFTGLGISRATEVRDLLRPIQPTFDDDVTGLLAQFQQESGSCVGGDYSGIRLDEQLADSRARMRSLFARGLDARFDLNGQTALRRRYGYANGTNNNDPAVRAAVAAQLLATGLTRTVTLTLQGNLDQHQNWAALHPQRLRAGYEAMANLLDDLREVDPNLERTTLVAFSEFARTPRINGSEGRDHWFANSFLVFGGNLKRGVFGETVEQTLGLRAVDLATGRPASDGVVLRPEHVGATLAAAAGIDPGPFRAPPLDAWIEGGAS